jgi:GNAT superfamily N-acetyltransferase
VTAAPGLEVVRVHPDDPLAAPLFTELAAEYGARYGDLFGGAGQEMARYPATDFLPPDGELLLLVEDGAPVAGGAYRRHERAGTAEVKRMWTAGSHRRRGLARRVLAELQTRAAAAGYASMYLTTGPRQPEAVGLYLAAGWTPLFDPAVPRPTDADALRRLPEDQRFYAFTTTLGDPS